MPAALAQTVLLSDDSRTTAGIILLTLVLVYAGAFSLAVGVVTLGVGLL